MPRSIGRRAGALRRALGIHQAIPKLFADDANCLIFTVMLATLRKAFWACIVILCCLAPSANAAGIQLFNHGPALSGAIWYPCQAEPKHVDLGDQGAGVDYGLVGVKDCPITGGKTAAGRFFSRYGRMVRRASRHGSGISGCRFCRCGNQSFGRQRQRPLEKRRLVGLWVAPSGHSVFSNQ